MKKGITRILYGFVAIAAAVIMIGNMFNWWSISAAGWWTAFLIVPGLSSMIRYGVRFWNSFLTLGGIILLLKAQGLMPVIPVEAVYVFLLVILGLYLIFKPTKSYNEARPFSNAESNDNVVINENDVSNGDCVFSSLNICPEGYLAKGSYSCVFGNLTVDLKKVTVCENCSLKVDNVFGTTKIRTYGKCRVFVDGTQIFGSIVDNSAGRDNIALPTVNLKCSSVFGNVEII